MTEYDDKNHECTFTCAVMYPILNDLFPKADVTKHQPYGMAYGIIKKRSLYCACWCQLAGVAHFSVYRHTTSWKRPLHHLMDENQTVAIMTLNPLTTLKTLVSEVLVLCVFIIMTFLWLKFFVHPQYIPMY